jgi:hypothetical protein
MELSLARNWWLLVFCGVLAIAFGAVGRLKKTASRDATERRQRTPTN